MGVGIDDSRHKRPALQVHPLGIGSCHLQDAIIITNSQDLSVANRKRLGYGKGRLVLIHGQYGTVVKNDVGVVSHLWRKILSLSNPKGSKHQQ
jgi:hypothetical protein